MRYRVRIRVQVDALAASKAGLPLHFVGPDVTGMWGLPSTGPGVLVVARELAGAVETDLPVEVFESAEAARTPRLEDLVVVLLRRDPLLARAFVLRHADLLDPDRLLKRVLQENVEEAATKVRLQAVMPGLPTSATRSPSSRSPGRIGTPRSKEGVESDPAPNVGGDPAAEVSPVGDRRSGRGRRGRSSGDPRGRDPADGPNVRSSGRPPRPRPLRRMKGSGTGREGRRPLRCGWGAPPVRRPGSDGV